MPFFNQIFDKPQSDIGLFSGFWLMSQTFTILGSIAFGRWAIIKTGAIGFLVVIFVVFLNILLGKLFIGNMLEKISGNDFINIMNETKSINEMTIKIWALLTVLILPTIFLISSYFKLKEKQV